MAMFDQKDLNLEATALRLGLPGSKDPSPVSLISRSNKRPLPSDLINEEPSKDSSSATKTCDQQISQPPHSKAQVVGWPPVRSYRKNCFQATKTPEAEAAGIYVKISMDGAPYLRKIDLKFYRGYAELLKALEEMFKFTVGGYCERELGYSNRSEFVPTYEDKDGDWMLLGDVPWEMFITSCKRLRIMKGSEAQGLGCAL